MRGLVGGEVAGAWIIYAKKVVNTKVEYHQLAKNIPVRNLFCSDAVVGGVEFCLPFEGVLLISSSAVYESNESIGYSYVVAMAESLNCSDNCKRRRKKR